MRCAVLAWCGGRKSAVTLVPLTIHAARYDCFSYNIRVHLTHKDHILQSGPHLAISGPHLTISGPHLITISGPHLTRSKPHLTISGPHLTIS